MSDSELEQEFHSNSLLNDLTSDRIYYHLDKCIRKYTRRFKKKYFIYRI